MLPTVHYNMGGIPCAYTGEALTLKDGNPDTVVPGLMAVGEAACVSVHGANRLGSNSLIDLVVFGKAAGAAGGQGIDAADSGIRIAQECGRSRIGAFRPFPPCQGQRRRPPKLRKAMQKAMQDDAAVFRTGESLEQGKRRDPANLCAAWPISKSPTAR